MSLLEDAQKSITTEQIESAAAAEGGVAAMISDALYL